MQTNSIFSLFARTSAEQPADLSPELAHPVELSANELEEVAGGLSPNGTWASLQASSPNGTW